MTVAEGAGKGIEAARAMRATARWPGWPANTARRWCCWRITGAIRPRPCCCACCAAPGWRAWPPWRRCRAVTRWTTCGPGWTRTAMTSCEPAPPSRRPPAGARCRTRPIPIPITPARRCASCWRRRWTRAGPAGAASWRGMRATWPRPRRSWTKWRARISPRWSRARTAPAFAARVARSVAGAAGAGVALVAGRQWRAHAFGSAHARPAAPAARPAQPGS